MSLFQNYLKVEKTDERIFKIGISLCTNMKLQTPAVCEAGVRLFGAEAIKIMRNLKMSAAEVCYFVLQDYCEESTGKLRPLHIWNISLPTEPKPRVQAIQLPKEDAPKLKVLHLADTHYDPLYAEGSNANCAEPLCCRTFDEYLNESSSSASKWGEYKCDLPKRTLEHLLDHIRQTHKVCTSRILS